MLPAGYHLHAGLEGGQVVSFDLDDFLGGGPAIPAAPAKPAALRLVPAPVQTALVECPPPGIYYNIPAHVYHSWPAISSTLLKNYAKLPATAREPFEPKDDAGVGSGIHAYTLQGQAGLDEECFILPIECEGTSAKAKALRAEFEQAYPSKALLPYRYGKGPAEGKPFVMDVLRGVDKSFREHMKTKEILANAKFEVSLVWIDERSGCVCKARIDVLEDVTFRDVKKTLSFDKFAFQIRTLFYGVQLGHYRKGLIANGFNIVGAGFMPCEACWPYRVGCGYRDPDKLIEDTVESERLVGLVKQSQLSGWWPNYQIPPHIWDLDQIRPNDLEDIY
jgi:hypothetical protein